jgi:hypothetical protein
MTRMKSMVCLLFVMTSGVGCASSYQVELKNQTTQSVTLWLTKDGPPPEEGWYSPEQLATMPADLRAAYDLAIVPPGRTATTEPMAGEFPRGTNAVLRVYEGEKELFHILEDAKAGRERRIDKTLKKGMNRFVAVERDGRIAVEGGR